MELEGGVLVYPTAAVPVIEGDVVTAIRTLAGRGVGKKTIAREVGVRGQYGAASSAAADRGRCADAARRAAAE